MISLSAALEVNARHVPGVQHVENELHSIMKGMTQSVFLGEGNGTVIIMSLCCVVV